MTPDSFKHILENSGQDRFGLCMFVPAMLAELVNRRLNSAYGDTGDNLSVALVRSDLDTRPTYLAANYSSAHLSHAFPTIDIFAEFPGCVMLVTDPGVGSQSARTIGLVEHGRVTRDLPPEHSFYSFAEGYLGVHAPAAEIFQQVSLLRPELQITALLLDAKGGAAQILATPWEATLRRVLEDPRALDEFSKEPRRFEEFIAHSYERDGYQVTLTPRSGDGGVDVIAEKRGFGAVKILDQTKAYSAHRLVSANDVRAAVGVLQNFPDASKAVVTTTSQFAPGIFKEFSHLTPTRLELRDGHGLIDWLKSLRKE